MVLTLSTALDPLLIIFLIKVIYFVCFTHSFVQIAYSSSEGGGRRDGSRRGASGAAKRVNTAGGAQTHARVCETTTVQTHRRATATTTAVAVAMIAIVANNRRYWDSVQAKTTAAARRGRYRHAQCGVAMYILCSRGLRCLDWIVAHHGR